MASGGKTGWGELARAGSILLIVGLIMLALGLYSAMPYFGGESCSMAAIGLVMLFPIYAPAIAIGIVLLLVAWARGRGATAAAPTALRVATLTTASSDAPKSTRGAAGVLLYVGGALLLVYGWTGAFWGTWMMVAARYGTMGRSAYATLPGLLWNLLIGAAGVLMLLQARRR